MQEINILHSIIVRQLSVLMILIGVLSTKFIKNFFTSTFRGFEGVDT